MKITGDYPLLLVRDVAPAAAFYERHLGFQRLFDSDWYVQLRSSNNAATELALIVYDHETIPESGRTPTTGLLLSFEVEDAAAEYAAAQASGLSILQPLRDEPFGQRHFIMADPNGVLLDIITPIEPDAEWLAQQGA
ncbi:glyoxalase [Devosia limi DSM 17137]|uniref:Glyoxalase n=1 Tax=Devosia limi DSM 17137 TaxID=1121477 RepID=A0A0F5LVF4_9HYPH|nr:VOC family protein [Devosia limi]KKB86318.1 glyoxalase [Devosia limi DSM 17137]SHF73538.1 Uncharacterized conserved protein PhnB, glyoxalase superfamily [Devosia limi DSM 17137]